MKKVLFHVIGTLLTSGLFFGMMVAILTSPEW